MQLPFGPAIALLGIYPKAMEAYVHQKKKKKRGGWREKHIHEHPSNLSIRRLQTPKKSFNRWTVKQIGLYPHYGIQHSNKRKHGVIHTKTCINHQVSRVR